MGDDLLSFIFRDKRIRNKAIKTAAKVIRNASPIVRTIEAGHGILKIGETLQKAHEVAGKMSDIAPKASLVADRVNKFIPSMQVMGQSFCDSAKIFAYFSIIATTVQIGANMVQTYQGIQVLQLIAARLQDMSVSLAAQTALMAQKEFPEYVHNMIRERLTQTSDDSLCDHWFFLYHPDDDWYPKFFHFLEEKPLSPRFCGYTNQIDTVFVFMIAARRRITEMEYKARKRGLPIRPTRLHLLIPAYQPILIAEALKIPDEIGDFVMEGRINSNREFVWFNLPEEQRHYVVNIGHWVPPAPGWWDWAMSRVGLTEKPPVLGPPRALGTGQHPPEGDVLPGDGDEDDEPGSPESRGTVSEGSSKPSRGSEGQGDRKRATPLHHRDRRHHGRRTY